MAERYRSIGTSFLIFILVVSLIPVWFIFPPGDEADHADAVLVLAGASDGRHELAAKLIEEGYSLNLVVSNPDGEIEKVGSAYCRGSLQPKSAEEVMCMEPVPSTTTGEALTIREIAIDHGWDSIVVVTNRSHTRRVRTNFDQCTDLEAAVIPIENVVVWRIPMHVAREVAGYLKFWFTDSC